jgi:very-short-patch-repair endonuclease
MAAVLAFGDGAVLSHRHAAALWGLAGPVDTAIDVTVDGRNGRSRRKGLTPHRSRLHPEDRNSRYGIPVTSVARTLLDLAEAVSPTQLQRAYEAAERLELLDMRGLDAVLERGSGRRGVGLVRALADYDPTAAARARSELERRFLDLVRAAELPTPLVNTYVEGLEVDAHWPAARLVVELDSYEFHRGRLAFERDRAKIARLRLAGYEVLPLTDRLLRQERDWVVQSLRTLLGSAV